MNEIKGEVEKTNGVEKPPGLDREKTCPFLLRVFCSTSRHNPIQEYNRGHVPTNELQIYTWKDATLKELTSLVREVNPEARRKGTFFDFALVFPNPSRNTPQHYKSRDIGTTVSGQKGPDDSKTLQQVRFIIGDYVDIAITPPAGGRRDFGGGGGGRGGGGFGRRDRFERNDRQFRPLYYKVSTKSCLNPPPPSPNVQFVTLGASSSTGLHGGGTGPSGELAGLDFDDGQPQEGPDALFRGSCQDVQVEAALEGQNQFASSQLPQFLSHVGEARRGHKIAANGMRVADGRIKPCRHENDVRIVAPSNGKDDASEGSQIFGIAHRRVQTPRPSNVHVVAQARTRAAFHGSARAWVEIPIVVTVNGDEEDIGIIIKGPLSAIPVMNGPIEDQDPFDCGHAQQLLGRYGHRVEVAKAHGLI
eukprot:maker-scaffold83_size396513-snap-gene-2.29 protein:Tk00967 transcript:maker-scaffold83_size396513-snap-gene-2.29-mRNA-1 annotation:"histone deacetylase complex subunit sap18"